MLERKLISTATPCGNTDFSELKTQAITAKRKMGELETEERNKDQLHKPFSGEVNLTAPQRRSRKKTGDLGHKDFSTCMSEQSTEVQ